jgi:(2Fe-2S) ferredoxin
MPTVVEISSADLCGYRFVKRKSAARIVDEHGLDDEMSKPDRKTRQGHRLTRTGDVEEFNSEDIGNLHADANSTTRNGLCKSWVRLGTI